MTRYAHSVQNRFSPTEILQPVTPPSAVRQACANTGGESGDKKCVKIRNFRGAFRALVTENYVAEMPPEHVTTAPNMNTAVKTEAAALLR